MMVIILKYIETTPKDKLSLSCDFITDLVKDKSGNIWIATSGGGLNKFDCQTNTFIHYQHNNNKNSIASNYLSKLSIDRDGNLWVGMLNDGLDYFNTTTFKALHFKNNIADKNSLSEKQDNCLILRQQK